MQPEIRLRFGDNYFSGGGKINLHDGRLLAERRLVGMASLASLVSAALSRAASVGSRAPNSSRGFIRKK